MLAGCAVAPAGVEPIIDLGELRCDAAPNLSLALPLPEATPREAPVSMEFDSQLPCLRLVGERAGFYAAFRIAPERGAVVLTISSLPLGRTIMAPRVMLMDGNGRLTRALGPDAFLFRGAGLSALVRLRAEEGFVVVGSAPGMAGKGFDRVRSSMNLTAVPLGAGMIFIHHGSEATQQMVFGHNGRVVLETRAAEAATVVP